MKLTKRQVADIASATKANCHPDGFGHQILVWRDGSNTMAISDNDVIARGDGNNGWEYPVARFRVPMTRADVVAELAARGIEVRS